MKHLFVKPLKKGQESKCQRCGLRVTPLLQLSYKEYYTNTGQYGDTKYSPLPKCLSTKH